MSLKYEPSSEPLHISAEQLFSLLHQVVKLVEIDIPETLIEEQSKQKFANMMSDFKAKVRVPSPTNQYDV